jgi:septal ring factor EnvC (AmiA/AmiB activator)
MKPRKVCDFTIIGLVVTLLSALCVECAHGQSTTEQRPDLQQLQLKLQEMEQQMQEIRQQISTLQQNQKPQHAPQATSTKTEEELRQVVSEQASARTPSEEVGNEKLPPEQGTTLDLYGFVMLD